LRTREKSFFSIVYYSIIVTFTIMPYSLITKVYYKARSFTDIIPTLFAIGLSLYCVPPTLLVSGIFERATWQP